MKISMKKTARTKMSQIGRDDEKKTMRKKIRSFQKKKGGRGREKSCYLRIMSFQV